MGEFEGAVLGASVCDPLQHEPGTGKLQRKSPHGKPDQYADKAKRAQITRARSDNHKPALNCDKTDNSAKEKANAYVGQASHGDYAEA